MTFLVYCCHICLPPVLRHYSTAHGFCEDNSQWGGDLVNHILFFLKNTIMHFCIADWFGNFIFYTINKFVPRITSRCCLVQSGWSGGLLLQAAGESASPPAHPPPAAGGGGRPPPPPQGHHCPGHRHIRLEVSPCRIYGYLL